MTDIMNGDWVRRIRSRLGFTQQECAELVGVDVRSWKRYESGWPIPPAMQKLLQLMDEDTAVVERLEQLRDDES